MDPAIVKATRKKIKKRRAPPPPNPFTGEVDAPPPPVIQDEEDEIEDSAVSSYITNYDPLSFSSMIGFLHKCEKLKLNRTLSKTQS